MQGPREREGQAGRGVIWQVEKVYHGTDCEGTADIHNVANDQDTGRPSLYGITPWKGGASRSNTIGKK